MSNCIGLDISKKLIAVHIPKNSLDLEINNNITGMKKLISKLNEFTSKDLWTRVKKTVRVESDDACLIFDDTVRTQSNHIFYLFLPFSN